MDIGVIVNDIAAQMGLPHLEVSLEDGCRLGVSNVFLLRISTQDRIVNLLAYPNDIKDIQKSIISGRLEIRIRNSLSRLMPVLE